MCLIEIKTTAADFGFPTTNQTRHCFTRYVEFHRGMKLLNVTNLPSTTDLFAQLNGSKHACPVTYQWRIEESNSRFL
ncbi:hypothetical protein ZWY2020_037550 [Hordeum vulgare]|nr:hypothetical protein ZWY2020_037550 [Hordeum vulgare]